MDASSKTTTCHGGRYCCVINCSNNSKLSIDERTGKKIKLHSFPDPTKEPERCKKWIINIRRADLNMTNICSKKVCSVHFEVKAYSCPLDITNSRLLPTAVLTVINCPNPPPPFTPRRPLPRKRSSPCSKRPRSHAVDEDNCTGSPSEPLASNFPCAEPPSKKQHTDRTDTRALQKKLREVELALKMEKMKSKRLQRKLQAMKTMKKKKDAKEIELHRRLSEERKKRVQNLLADLPPVPAALMEVLLSGKKRINWKAESHRRALELCLAVFFRSSSAYSVLRSSGFQLPHPNTLRRRYSGVLTGTGICPELLEMVRIRASVLKDHEKRITLSFDGMTLKQQVIYKRHSDELIGFVDHGNGEHSRTVADQGIVVMIRGLTLKWKQIVGYFIARHNMKANTLHCIITNTVKLLENQGLFVDAIVMDQESSQWKMVNDWGVSGAKPYVMFNSVKSYIVPDPPHLIKSLRNNFISKDVEFRLNGKDMKAKWCYLQMLFEIDSSKPVRAVPKWTKDHFDLPRGKKMKVKLACQIFSHSAAAAMRLYIANSLLPVEASQTADFLETVNTMWDFIDSHALNAPPGRRAVSSKYFDQDEERFDFYINFVESWKFQFNEKEKKIPSHSGWRLAVHALKSLAKDLIKEQKILTHLCLRKVNQDHVENLHSQIRGFNGFNDHPSVESYVNALRCLACSFSTTELLDRTASTGSNCLPDEEHTLPLPQSNSGFLQEESPQENVSSELARPTENISITIDSDLLPLDEDLPVIETNVVEYIAGFVARKIIRNYRALGLCDMCLELLTTTFSSDTGISLTTLKEFKPGCMLHVSEGVFNLCKAFENHFQIVTKEGLPIPQPRQSVLSSFIKSYNVDVNTLVCSKNHSDALVKAILSNYCDVRIFHCVKILNQSLRKGKKGAELNKQKKLNL